MVSWKVSSFEPNRNDKKADRMETQRTPAGGYVIRDYVLDKRVESMTVSTPHYLLFSESHRPRTTAEGYAHHGHTPGRWRFVLETVDGDIRLEASDEEFESEEGRLALLAVVRGLEALEQPSRVTVVTPSRYVSRGFLFGLEEWRENGWRWERFGEMTPIKNRDLWQRIDQAMQYHQVECRVWRFDMPDAPEPTPEPAPAVRAVAAPLPAPAPRRCVPAPKHRSKQRSRPQSAKSSRHATASWREVVRDPWQRCRSRLRGESRLQAA